MEKRRFASRIAKVFPSGAQSWNPGRCFQMPGHLGLILRNASGNGPALVQGKANAEHENESISPN